MVETILTDLGPVLTRWTMGGSALGAAPAAWRDRLGDAAEAELRLLALSGQFLGALVLPEPAGPVADRADLPRLSLPPIPDPMRPRVRRILHQLRDAAGRRALLDFLDGRGWTLHPADWLPEADAEVPDVYAPWQDWAAAAGHRMAAGGPLTKASWDGFAPAARLAAVAALRRRAPAEAATLLAEKMAGEAADHRLRLLATLPIGLSDADLPLLQALAADRAPRVKALAAALLAQLGRGDDAGQDSAELVDFFAVQTRGLLRRTRHVVPTALKTPAQRSRRAALLETQPFQALARALALDPIELVAAWEWRGDAIADHQLLAMIARSAPDAVVEAGLAALLAAPTVDPQLFALLAPRLSPGQRRRAAAHVLDSRGESLSRALAIAGGDARLDGLVRVSAWRDLLAALRQAEARPGELAEELLAAGLLAARPAARQALDQARAAGLVASDPRLDMLALNAALDDQGEG